MKKILKIGELAKELGITVRTLHHYDAIGLLSPTLMRDSGIRFYGPDDVKRLQQIISLKAMGFSLKEISRFMDEKAYDLQSVLQMHEEAIQNKVHDLEKILGTLHFLLSRLNHDKELSMENLLTFIREVKMMESIYTPEQQKKLKERLGRTEPKKIEEVQKGWSVLFQKFGEAMNKKLDPSCAEVQELAAKAQEYIDKFTGCDKGIEKNLDAAYEKSQAGALEEWGVSKELFDYATKARKIFLRK